MHRLHTAGLLAAGAALALAASPALAQDDDTRSDYTGLYVAISGGAALQENDGDDTVVFDTDRNGTFNNIVVPLSNVGNAFSPGFCGGAAFGPAGTGQSRTGPNVAPGIVAAGTLIPAQPCRSDKDDMEFSVKIGYDQQLGSNFVAGVVLEGSMNDAEDSTTAFSTTPASYTFTRGLDYAISARGRFGYTPDGSGLFYITGGPSYGRLDHDFNTTNVANTFVQRGGDSVWGYQFGGGAEFTLDGGLGVGIEYLYNSYDDEDYFVAIGPSTPRNPFREGTNFRPSDNDFAFHAVRVNLIYKFGRGGIF